MGGMWALERTVVGGHKSVSQGPMQTQRSSCMESLGDFGVDVAILHGALDSTSHRVSLVFLGESRGDLVAENASQIILAFPTLESIYSS